MGSKIALSESAVAVLRLEIKGYRPGAKGNRLAEYRELVAAGIMEPVPGSESEYRFTEEGLTRREQILQEEADRIEREQFEPPDASKLSAASRDLLRRIVLDKESPQVTPETRPLYRELAAARIMFPISGFVGGPESVFRFTYWGWSRRHEWIAHPSELP